jgi:hypothetical protein
LIADAGTVTEICVVESTLNCVADAPPKLTEALESNFDPVITITLPGTPADGAKDWTVGLVAEGEEFSWVELAVAEVEEFSSAGVLVGGGVEFPFAAVFDEVGEELSPVELLAGGSKFSPFKLASPSELPPPQPASIGPPQSTVAVCALFCKNRLREFSAAANCAAR